MSTQKILQSIEIIKIIDGMEYFSIEERLAILSDLCRNIRKEENPIVWTESILQIKTPEDWSSISTPHQLVLEQTCTHPLVSEELSSILYIRTQTEMAPPDQEAIAKMQADITKEAEQEFEEWMTKQENDPEQFFSADTKIERTEHKASDEHTEPRKEYLFPSPPVTDNNWDIAFVVFQPIKGCFHIHFLRSGKTQIIPCNESSTIAHSNPHVLKSSLQSVFPDFEPTEKHFAAFHTPIFSKESFLKKYNKKKKKLFILQLRHFYSNPFYSSLSFIGDRLRIQTTTKHRFTGCSLEQEQQVSVRWPYAHDQPVPSLGSLIKKKGDQYVFEGRTQQSMGWKLIWVDGPTLPIYVQKGEVQFHHTSSGSHSNKIRLDSIACAASEEDISTSHHKMPFSGILQTIDDANISDLKSKSQHFNHRLAPQVGRTGSIDISQEKTDSSYEANQSLNLISEFRGQCRMVEKNSQFSASMLQRSNIQSRVIIPITSTYTLTIENGEKDDCLRLTLGEKSWTYTSELVKEPSSTKRSIILEKPSSHSWKNSIAHSTNEEEVILTYDATHVHFGYSLND